jgi:prepilin-type N-terminal cleavage/methylation domain-containing protein
MGKAQSREAGFTLVELLVSLALLSLIAVYVLNSFTLMRQMKVLLREAEGQTEVRSVLRQFEREVSSLTPFFSPAENAAPKLVFEGHRDQITYAVLSNGAREEGGLHLVTWLLDLKGRLVVERRMFNAAKDGTKRLVVLQGVKSLELTYDDGQSAWLAKSSLPHVVVLKLTLDDRPLGPIERRAAIMASQ